MEKLDIDLEKNSTHYFDYGIFIPVILLTIIGLYSIFSATRGIGQDTLFIRQAISALLGLSSMFVVIFLPKKFFETFWIPIYIVSTLLLVGVLLFGEVVYGTKGWLRIGSLSLQPAEFSKFAVILSLAGFIAGKGVYLANIRDLTISVSLAALQFILIWLQPDHGSSSVILVILVAIMYWSGFNKLIIYMFVTTPILILLAFKGFTFYIIAAVVFSAIIIFMRRRIILTILSLIIYSSIGFITPIVYNQLQAHQKLRIEAFINPTSDPLGSGYNVLQSVMAVGSGGIYGKGVMQGSQTQLRYIPMQWTDFIFSVPAEELGFLGSLLVIVLFLVLLIRIIKIAAATDNKFNSIACFGIAAVFFYHITINIGMVIGLTPVMGLPLPFMSYGGTYLIVNFIFIGFVLYTNRVYVLKRID
ncbi:MAG TPA: FtsW/RodA/SpoVE family cell cycle protein [Candidatus Kapabacteria bacterium]|nr:FtsW/RodA/SpoVE family cell cycle protein [Candidatus Kapabacteria bacterium]